MAVYRGVSGVNREIKKIYRGVSGVSREIKEVWRGVGGVNRKVFAAAQAISNLTVGSKVYITENNANIPFIILIHGYPVTGRSLLIREDSYLTRTWGERAIYIESAVDTWLNADYLNLLPSSIRSLIINISLPVATTARGTIGTAQRKIFLLSNKEVNISAGDQSTVEGTAIPYFDSNTKRISKYNGSAASWFLRSNNPDFEETVEYMRGVSATGTGNNLTMMSSTAGIRPTFTLSSTTQVSANPDSSGIYSLVL